MDIGDILPYAQFIAQIALVFAAGFAGYQFLMHRRERRDQQALEVLTHLQSAEFQAAYTKVWDLPVAATVEEVRQQGAAMEDAAETVAMTFERLGVLVYNRIVPMDVVDQVIGGFLRESWRRLQAYIVWKRDRVGSQRVAEWYQWLAERLEVQRRRRNVGAYEAFKDWRG